MASLRLRKRLLSALAGLLAMMQVGCGTKATHGPDGASRASLLSLVRNANEPAPDPGVQSAIPARYGEVTRVEGFPDQPPFNTVARQGHLETYPCSQCHDKPLAGMLALRKKDQPNSHWQIVQKHAPEHAMSCQTCHGAGDQDKLVTLTGQAVSMDAPFQVCAQCHSTQVNDWAGGAHGKRLGGWAPPRVVENCTGCHNPHAPAFESRWPAVLGKGSQNYPGR
ncbi:MAG: hypothetical protein KIT83_12175 [Bryobacterales bacterium]|nr:hypothetical protein [Bryobacterales bacterium]